MRAHIITAGFLALASRASAQVASVCPTSSKDVCFKLNIPANTASSGNGDIFFQISAPTSYEWVSLGQGSGMSGANIFVIYTNSAGNNVTISPRLGTGHSTPNFNGNAQVTLLEGSGVSGGKMVANVKCSNCNKWSGGSADFTSGNGNWIWASKSGSPKNSDSQSANIAQHGDAAAFSWSYASAKGGNSVNPLVASGSTPSGTGTTAGGGSGVTSCVPRPTTGSFQSAAAATTSGAAATQTAGENENQSEDSHRPTGFPTNWASYGRPTAAPTGDDHGGGHGGRNKRQEINYCDSNSPTNNNGNGFTPLSASSGPARTKKMLIAHGTMAALAFVIFFPAGSIVIRLASFPGVIWLHAAFQVFAYLVYIVAFGLGVYIANDLKVLNNYHPIIGIVVFICLFFQPIFGFLHHSLFKKYGSRTFWSYSHLWLGRAVITLGIINGGLGFKLANTMGMGSRTGMIVYSVVAGIMWLIMVAATIAGELRRRKAGERPPKYTDSQTDSPRETEERADIPPPAGHYAPRG
ncbi:hypothetical protein BCR34DRAFT_626738 [Clohesyomyces aquaticus]|uniref:Cytochrome b561 domain-containing protein n=1 Tax=Clohesyomyces aquaticus TaxID=1231657 RepID=A0A1Y1Z826_9PLEO|nr:hypothetical protein BCR34DRAFT_626738 [Clohesyomyces aquaticus]